VAGAGDCILGQHLISSVTGPFILYLLCYIHLNSAERQLLGFLLLLLSSANCIWYAFWGYATAFAIEAATRYLSRHAGLLSIQKGHITRANTAALNQTYVCKRNTAHLTSRKLKRKKKSRGL